MREVVTMRIIMGIRVFENLVMVMDMIAKPLSWNAPLGTWTTNDVKGEKPKPLTIMLEN